jgi:predicted phage tail protein
MERLKQSGDRSTDVDPDTVMGHDNPELQGITTGDLHSMLQTVLPSYISKAVEQAKGANQQAMQQMRDELTNITANSASEQQVLTEVREQLSAITAKLDSERPSAPTDHDDKTLCAQFKRKYKERMQMPPKTTPDLIDALAHSQEGRGDEHFSLVDMPCMIKKHGTFSALSAKLIKQKQQTTYSRKMEQLMNHQNAKTATKSSTSSKKADRDECIEACQSLVLISVYCSSQCQVVETASPTPILR